MKNISNLKVAKFFAWFGVILALSMLGKHLIHYQVLGGSLEHVNSFAPLDRDIPTEIVTSLVVGRKDADSLLKLAHISHEEIKSLHSAWLQSVELHRSEAFFQIFLWAVVMVSFMAIAISVERFHGELTRQSRGKPIGAP